MSILYIFKYINIFFFRYDELIFLIKWDNFKYSLWGENVFSLPKMYNVRDSNI